MPETWQRCSEPEWPETQRLGGRQGQVTPGGCLRGRDGYSLTHVSVSPRVLASLRFPQKATPGTVFLEPSGDSPGPIHPLPVLPSGMEEGLLGLETRACWPLDVPGSFRAHPALSSGRAWLAGGDSWLPGSYRALHTSRTRPSGFRDSALGAGLMCTHTGKPAHFEDGLQVPS